MLHRHLQQGAAHFGWLAAMLKDGRPFLLGESTSAADLAAYYPLWLLKTRVGAKAEALLPLAPLNACWYERLSAMGHGMPLEMTVTDALTVAAQAEPEDLDHSAGAHPSGIALGREVIVRADDTGRDAIDSQKLVIRSENPRVGKVNIHFPRAGFDVVAA